MSHWLTDLTKTAKVEKQATYRNWVVTIHLAAMAEMEAADVEKDLENALSKMGPGIDMIEHTEAVEKPSHP